MSQSVGVAIVTFNSADTIGRCMRALAAQSRLPRRIVVVDSGSPQGPPQIDESWPPGVEIVPLAENVGFAAGNNRAFDRLRDCDWIALVNPDAYPEPDWLEALLRVAVARSEFSFFASRLILADTPDRLDGVGDAYHTSGLMWRTGHGCPEADAFVTSREVFAPCAAAALYRADQLRQIGGFDERYFCYSEDVDLGFRLRLMGARCLYVADARVHHVGSASTGVGSDFSVYYGHRNLVWTFFKNMPGGLLMLYLLPHLLLNLGTIVRFALAGRLRVILRAKRDAVLGLPAILKTRRDLQASRVSSGRSLLACMDRGWPRRGRCR